MEKKNNDDNFIKNNPLIFKKYRPIKKLAKGTFSDVYSGINIYTKEKVAIKLEKRNIKNKYLDSECYLLFSLKNVGFPKVLSFGHNKEYDILIMPLLGKSLRELYISRNSNFEFKDICLMGIQIIERIHWVHSKKIIHRDIKPDNFLIGLNDPNIIYLIDFGLSKKYKSSQTGNHIKFVDVKKFTGTILYSSINALKLKEQSRRDDLESIGYMLIFLMKGYLPWMGIKVTNQKESYLKLSKMKKDTKLEKLCENLPMEFMEYMKYVRNLEFEGNPDYNYLKDLFEQMLKNRGIEDRYLYFSWINSSKMKAKIKPFNLSKKKSCSRERIMNKIRKCLEEKRSFSEVKNTQFFNNLNDLSENKLTNNIKVKNNINIEEQMSDNNIKNDLNKNFYKDNNNNIKINNINNINNNKQINFLNNSINNNFISISFSIYNNNFINKRSSINKQLNTSQNVQTFSINRNNAKMGNNNGTFFEPTSIINLNKNKKLINKKNFYDEQKVNSQYQGFSPTEHNSKKKMQKIFDTNSSINFKLVKKKINNLNNIIQNNNNNINIFSSFNNVYNKTKDLQKTKTDYKIKKKYYNTNNNLNGPKFLQINQKNYNTNNTRNNCMTNRNTNNQMKMSNFCNSSNLSYNNLKERENSNYNNNKKTLIKNKSNNNIKIINTHENNKNNKNNSNNNSRNIKGNNFFYNFYNKNIRNKKLLDVYPFIKKTKSEIKESQDNNRSRINKNELMNELQKFNLRYNNEEILNDKGLFQKKIRNAHPRMNKTNQSADHYKAYNLKNSAHKFKLKSNNNENNCTIY